MTGGQPGKARESPGLFGSVRARLLAIALVPMLVVLPLFVGLLMANWSARFDRLLIAKVNGELTIAHQYMFTLLDKRAGEIEALAGSAAMTDARAIAASLPQTQDGAPDSQTYLRDWLEARRQALGLDFLFLTRADGVLVAAPRGAHDLRPDRWPVVRDAFAGKRAAGIDVFTAEDLAAISPELASQARIALVPTEAAVPSARTEETRGMVLHIAAPVVHSGGDVLVGGVLLNRNLDFIDTINDLVYPKASLTEGSRGTATLFLEDVRVSTNVRLFENVRALGTRVSAVVRARVLDQGAVWLDRAFVVNDWYISAYEPIIDSHGQRVGMLYVGFLDTPFRAAKMRTLWLVIAGFLAVAALSVPIFLRWTRSIVTPLERMVDTISAVEGGDLAARTHLTGGQYEIARVSAHLDQLLDQLEERAARLRDWAAELEKRVEARTHALQEANRRLEATTKQLVVSEKLASIGEITAGIAHEINNPVAVIEGNLDVIREATGDKAGELETEFKLIYEQTHAINVLVGKLLQFARPEEYAGVVDYHVPNQVMRDCIPLAQHLLAKVDIRLECDLTADRAVAINRTELQQVLINLIVNAIHAMPKGGTLTLASENHDHHDTPGVCLSVRDTGIGMAPDVLKSIFDPFFTTKRSQGTGLGLSISHDLVRRSGGWIRAASTPGAGTIFTLWLPAVEDSP